LASTTWNRAPLAAMYLCCQGPGISTTPAGSEGRAKASGYFRWNMVLVSCAWWIARSGARTFLTFLKPTKARRAASRR
jgi:hypothetical protein